MEGYGAFLLMFLITLSVATIMAFLNDILGTKKKDPLQDYPYECGVPVYDQEARGNFKQGYYMFGLLLILFDIEVAFLFPWAVVFRDIGLYGLIEAILFITILFLGFVYAWRKKALKWQS